MTSHALKTLLLFLCSHAAFSYADSNQTATTPETTPKVVSSIYPLQQIANEIVGEPTDLIADSYLSPHHYSLKPSDINGLQDADIVLWIGSAMMPQLKNTIKNREKNENHTTITASTLPGIQLITEEKGHGHDDHGHGHDDHGHDHHESDLHNKAGEPIFYDPHLWLSTENAITIATALAAELGRIDSAHQARYEVNLAQFIAKINRTRETIRTQLAAEAPKPYFIFHNAYAYFEQEFGIKHQGVIRNHSAQQANTQHLNEIKNQLSGVAAACLFTEPQFESPIIKKLAEGSSVTVSILDPVGYSSTEQTGYAAILENLANAVSQCPSRKL